MEETLKPLNKIKFDTIGDEYIYLLDTINTNNIIIVQATDKNPSIEELRIAYKELTDNQNKLENRYQKSSIYWSQAQEDAIIEFALCQDEEEKNRIFSKKIYKPLKKLIENIMFTYKLIRSDVSVSELQADCMSFLITKLDRYSQENGAAYSYLGTISKHYLMGEKKNAYKNTKNNLDIDENIDEISEIPENVYHLDDLDDKRHKNQLFDDVIVRLEEEIKKPKMLNNDRKVGEAIIWIFKNHEILRVYNKNLVYHLLKERTGLQTKEITYSLSRFKNFYKAFKQLFIKKEQD